MKDKIYQILPVFLQEFLISVFNLLAYKKRYGRYYVSYLELFKNNENLSLDELKRKQAERYRTFMEFVQDRSPFFKKRLSELKSFADLENIAQIPVLTKEELRKNINDVVTIKPNEKKIVSKTGGTTGKSLKIYFTERNMQERFAMLDNFRARYGYALGKKTAWFSGKALLTAKDVKKRRFWKTDHLHKVRYYSTFHVKDDYLKYYVEDLIKYQPEYLVGFPSTILEIARYGLENDYNYPENTVKAIFPTAETITADMRSVIEAFFKARMYNQYASSEGAPFIFECGKGNLHLELQSGVFEVLDEYDTPAQAGRLVVTSFTTEGTPLIRYDIGDSIVLEDEGITCTCDNHNPLVKEILGRIDDFVFSPENGKINLGNVSNTLKDTKGILKFQVVQNSLESIDIYIVVDETEYSVDVERKFLQNWQDRVGNKMQINLRYTDSLSVENSGKFRIVKNNIKHLIGN